MAQASRVRSLLAERNLWGTLGSVFEGKNDRRVAFGLAAILTGSLAVHASEPWWGQLFGGDTKNSSTSSNGGNAGGIPEIIIQSPSSSPTATPTRTAEATAVPTATQRPTIKPTAEATPTATVAPTPTAEKATTKPHSNKPLQCDIKVEDVFLNEDETILTFTPTITGGKPDPTTTYLVFDRGSDPFEDAYAVRQGMERPVSLENDGYEVVVYFVHPSNLPRDLQPSGGLNPTIPTASLAHFQGQCGIVMPWAATTPG